jgi:hypothetical protein
MSLSALGTMRRVPTSVQPSTAVENYDPNSQQYQYQYQYLHDGTGSGQAASEHSTARAHQPNSMNIHFKLYNYLKR